MNSVSTVKLKLKSRASNISVICLYYWAISTMENWLKQKEEKSQKG